MTERPWRIEVAPVHRSGWSSDPSPGNGLTGSDSTSAIQDVLAAATRPIAVPISRGRPWDPFLVAIVVVGLVAALLKPWGATILGNDAPAIARDPAVAHAPAAAALAKPPTLGVEVFAPPARSCMVDVGWRVCALGATVAAIQTVRNEFAPNAAAPLDGGGKPRLADPVVVLATTSGAALAFYAPVGFYSADAAPAAVPTRKPDETDPAPVVASGPVQVVAWHVDETLGIRTLSLATVRPVIREGSIAANVLIPVENALSAAEAWAAGRYIVWLKGGGMRSWEEFFDFEVIGDVAPAPR
jgi:hypothetical protein